jgi:putative aminopeptidase FrvX
MTGAVNRAVALVVALAGAVSEPAFAQPLRSEAAAHAVASWIVLDAPPGSEEQAVRVLAAALPGWSADARGNLVRRLGSGRPRRVVACALDQSAYVVSQITDEGYLRLRTTGTGTGHPLWHQFHEAQRVRILTAGGVVPGITAVANGHFAAQHRGDTTVVNADQLWVDVGASSRAEAERLGIALLDPVFADRPAWTFQGYAAGPAAGARAGCAAVATAAQGRVTSGETIFVISAGRTFGWLGLVSVLIRVGPVDAVMLLDNGRAAAPPADLPAAGRGGRGGRGGGGRGGRGGPPPNVVQAARVDSVRVVAPAVRWPGTLVETIGGDDADSLLQNALRGGAVELGGASWVALPLDTALRRSPRADAYDALERQFTTLADLPGVPGHEWRVREAIRAALPEWARRIAVVDSAGNLIVSAGPERDSVAFIAHMDEVGFEVAGVLADGRAALATRGGAVVTAWEGRPAYAHFDPGADGRAPESLRGVFVPRDTASRKSPGALTAWFGLDSATLVGRGVRPGTAVLGYKRAQRLGGARVNARSSDDRTGSTALLTAVRRVDPAALPHKAVFVWSVREEGGLNGARAFGAVHGASLKRVYAVDTFVSSDTPLESPHFAFAPLGKGAVLRGLDNSTLGLRSERNRVVRVARANAIPLQIGTTYGGTDASAVSGFGPPGLGLSWPGRYSHSPAEVLDLRDVDALARLIAALAREP